MQPAETENATAVALGLVGDEWNLAILRLAFEGVRRFGDWQSRLGVSNSVLTTRLRRLTKAGLLVRVRYQDAPPREEYQLGRPGKDLWRVLLAIWSWEAQWVTDHRETLPAMRHRGCGEVFVPVLCCARCGSAVDDSALTARFGPSGGFARSVPRVGTRRRSAAGADAPAQGPGLVPQTIALIGNRWAAMTLAAAFLGARRFTEFQQMTGAPPAIVSDRLHVFCEMGVLVPTPLPDSTRVDYRLTPKGRAFFPFVVLVTDWGDRWFRAPEGPATILRHEQCGSRFAPVLHCSCCGVPLRAVDVIIGDRVPYRS
jgi:DNA-binding HxlR family transcriptional regulator